MTKLQNDIKELTCHDYGIVEKDGLVHFTHNFLNFGKDKAKLHYIWDTCLLKSYGYRLVKSKLTDSSLTGIMEPM